MNAGGIAGGTAGWLGGAAAGAAVGTAVAPGVGTTIGGIVGGIFGAVGGGLGGSVAAKAGLDQFVPDDLDVLQKILREELERLAQEYLVTDDEMRKLGCDIEATTTPDWLQRMFRSEDRADRQRPIWLRRRESFLSVAAGGRQTRRDRAADGGAGSLAGYRVQGAEVDLVPSLHVFDPVRIAARFRAQ